LAARRLALDGRGGGFGRQAALQPT